MARSQLAELHPYLYKRVRLKFILFSLLGLSEVFAVPLNNFFHTAQNNGAGINTIVSGLIFLVIGLGIGWGLYGSYDKYRRSRPWLYAAFIYAVFWEFILILLLFTKHISTISVFILWGYLTYNLGIILRDTGWGGAALMKEIQEQQNGSE